MSLLAHLRFLRPLRSLIVAAFYTGIAGNWGRVLLGLDSTTAWFIALTVVLPLMLGLVISGAVHEPMHRPFALLLPNLRQRQRQAAAASVLVAALLATCAATWWNPAISPAAIFGLTCALIALPCVDRHRLLANQAAPLAAFLGWLFAGKILGPNLALAMNAAPWLFLPAGLLVATASLAGGFSRERLRVRAHTLFIAYQTAAFSLAFHHGMLAHWQAEVLAQRNLQRKKFTTEGRDWTVRSVGATSLDWMRVFWHAKFGAGKSNSFLPVQRVFITTTTLVAFLAGAAALFGQKTYWETLAQCAAPDMGNFSGGLITGIGVNFMLVLPGMATVCALAFATPQLSYPISRVRLARVVFWQTVVQWAIALVVPATALFVASLLGQFMSGQFRPGYGLPALLAADLPLAVLLPLLVAAGTLRTPVLRILSAVPLLVALMMGAFSRPAWESHLLTPLGIIGVLAASAAVQWLLWRRLHRDYAMADLPTSSGLTQLIGLAH